MASSLTNATPKKSIFDVDESSMRANKVDQASSMLISLVILIGMAVLILTLFFLMRITTESQPAISLAPESIAGRGDHSEGYERDFDPPSSDEVDQLNEPAMEQTLQLVSETIGTVSSALDGLDSAMAGDTSGKGDSRPPGPEGEGDNIIPKYERWELKFTARDRRNYAIQLEAFKIDVGAIGGGIPTIDYVTNVSSAPAKKSVTPKEEKARKRLKFVSLNENVLLQYERQILQAAGVPHNGRQVIKFLPNDAEQQLAMAEATYYRDRRSKDIR
ncbi:MAG: hypothetical protein ABL921_32195, partial [Pirellula sp.]